MENNVNNVSKMPDGSDFLYTPFENFKVSFLLLLSFVVLVYIIIFVIVQRSSGGSSGGSMSVLGLELILWIVLIIVIYVNIKNYDEKNYNFQTSFKNLFNSKLAELEVKAKSEELEKKPKECDEEKEDEGNKEVFHLPNNKFTYEGAHEACKRLGSRLATYDEMENAYNNGANWCSYGWSSDQLALFPTQKSTYNELKQIPGHENDCGRPGINGGFMKNKLLKFGVNCYGVKPQMTDKDETYMHSLNHSPALTKEEEEKAKKEYANFLTAPFNNDTWSYKK